MGQKQPDFGEVAAAQGEENRATVNDQLWANRPTIYTPWGYQGWNVEGVTDPATGDPVSKWSMTQGLSPELQGILNKQIAVQDNRTNLAGNLTERMGNEFNTPMQWDNLTPLHSAPTPQYTMPEGDVGNPYETRQKAEDAMYNTAMSRIQPMQEGQREALELKMRNQGLRPGDAAWQAQVQNLGQQHTDQNNQALWSSVGEGREESGQMFGQQMSRNQNNFNQAYGSNQANFGQAMTSANYANALRQQQMTEEMQKRGFSLNEINALLSGQQVGMPQMPNFSQAGQAQPAPVMTGAAQQASLNNANNPWGTVGTVAGGILGGIYGGPAGAAAGASIGGAAGSQF